jgi:hypothetical protein
MWMAIICKSYDFLVLDCRNDGLEHFSAILLVWLLRAVEATPAICGAQYAKWSI